MEYVILGLLMMQDCSLYDLQKFFKAGINLFYSSSYGSIQRAVEKCVQKGWVSFVEVVESGRNKKVHSIEPSGTSAFMDWMKQPVLRGNKMETQALSKLYFLGLLEENPDKARVMEDIQKAVEEALAELEETHQEILEQHQGIEHHPRYKFQIKTLEYGIHSHRAALEWFRKETEELR